MNTDGRIQNLHAHHVPIILHLLQHGVDDPHLVIGQPPLSYCAAVPGLDTDGGHKQTQNQSWKTSAHISNFNFMSFYYLDKYISC